MSKSMAKSRPTKLQMKRLIELVSNDPQLIAGKLSSNFTYKMLKERWKQIADELNSLPGAEKSFDKWKKAWQDTRATAKTKAATIKKYNQGTGGGPPCDITLSNAQLNILPLLSQVAVSGHTSSLESSVHFDFSTNENSNIQCTSNSIQGEIDNENIHIDTLPVYIENEEKELLSNCETEVQQFDKELDASKAASKLKRSATQRLLESQDVANRIADLTAKKIELKSEYYSKKLKLMENNNALLSSINMLLMSHFNGKSND